MLSFIGLVFGTLAFIAIIYLTGHSEEKNNPPKKTGPRFD